MRIGMDTGSTSRIDGALAGIDYEYTWAWDASKQASVSGMGVVGSPTIVHDGIYLTHSNSTSGAPTVFEEDDFTTGSCSSPSDDIPDGSLSPLSDSADPNGPHENVVGHPGRYFSVVATLHKCIPTSAPLSATTELFGHLITLSTSASHSTINITGLGKDPSHYNGVSRSVRTQSEINSILGKPLAITYDMVTGYRGNGIDDDPTSIKIYTCFQTNMDEMEATIHGFVLSNKPPRIYHLPVPINNPSI